MELLKPRKFAAMAAAKIAKELDEFKGDRYGEAVKKFVASTLTNFCEQDERFAQVVYETPATLSDCCEKIMKGCGSHISDIDVYRGAVRYYFPNAEIQFTMTIDASGDMPAPDEMAKPQPRKAEKDGNSTQPTESRPHSTKRQKAKKRDIPTSEKKTAEKPAQLAQERKSKKPDKDDSLIQLSLF